MTSVVKALQELFSAQHGLQINVVHFNVAAASCPWLTACWLFSEALHLSHLAIQWGELVGTVDTTMKPGDSYLLQISFRLYMLLHSVRNGFA